MIPGEPMLAGMLKASHCAGLSGASMKWPRATTLAVARNALRQRLSIPSRWPRNVQT